jgi:hypothetical protein
MLFGKWSQKKQVACLNLTSFPLALSELNLHPLFILFFRGDLFLFLQRIFLQQRRQQHHQKVTDLAKWTDWGIVPDQAFGMGLGGMLNGMVMDKLSGFMGGHSPEVPQEFDIFLPKGAQPGDSIEVRLVGKL